MSPQTLPLQEETESRSEYIASHDQLPDSLFFSVLCAGVWLVSLAEQLVDNQTNNLAEFYIAVLHKNGNSQHNIKLCQVEGHQHQLAHVFTKQNWDMGMGYLWLNGWGIYDLTGGALYGFLGWTFMT